MGTERYPDQEAGLLIPSLSVEAEPLLLAGLEDMRQTNPARLPKAHEALAELYEAWVRPEDADVHRVD